MSKGKRRGSKPMSIRARELPTPKRAPVVVRFKCPLCGGPHSKADHQEFDPRSLIRDWGKER